MARGRPLRFIGGVLAGWTGIRIALLWPAVLPLPTLDAVPVLAAAPVLLPVRGAATNIIVSRRPRSPATLLFDAKSVEHVAGPPSAVDRPATAPASHSGRQATNLPQHRRALSDAADVAHNVQRQVIAPPLVSLPATASRLTIDAWFVARPGGGDTIAFGQLGASQGGARVTYALGGNRRIALSARLAAPLRGAGGEAGLGVDIQPTRLPVHFLVEQRIGIDGGGARPTAVVIAGASAALPERFRLDAYAQGGAVWRRGGFFDGAALMSKTVSERGRARLELGGGAWSAAQRRVARLDIGPSIALVAPAGRTSLRVQLDYGIM